MMTSQVKDLSFVAEKKIKKGFIPVKIFLKSNH
jgi:hypothetical protein